MFEQLSLKCMDPAMLLFCLEEEVDSWAPVHKNKVMEAAKMAAFCHSHQLRDSRGPLPKDPYITHPYRNAVRALRWGVKDASLICGILLHDAPEDALDKLSGLLNVEPDYPAVFTELAARFSPEMSDTVAGVTNPVWPQSLTRDQKRLAYITHVEAAVRSNPRVAVAKVSDWVDNAGSVKYLVLSPVKRQQYLAAKYLPLADSLKKAVTVSPFIPEANKADVVNQVSNIAATLEVYCP